MTKNAPNAQGRLPTEADVPPVERARLRAKCLELAMVSRREGENIEAIQERAGAYLAWVLR